MQSKLRDRCKIERRNRLETERTVQTRDRFIIKETACKTYTTTHKAVKSKNTLKIIVNVINCCYYYYYYYYYYANYIQN